MIIFNVTSADFLNTSSAQTGGYTVPAMLIEDVRSIYSCEHVVLIETS